MEPNFEFLPTTDKAEDWFINPLDGSLGIVQVQPKKNNRLPENNPPNVKVGENERLFLTQPRRFGNCLRR